MCACPVEAKAKNLSRKQQWYHIYHIEDQGKSLRCEHCERTMRVEKQYYITISDLSDSFQWDPAAKKAPEHSPLVTAENERFWKFLDATFTQRAGKTITTAGTFLLSLSLSPGLPSNISKFRDITSSRPAYNKNVQNAQDLLRTTYPIRLLEREKTGLRNSLWRRLYPFWAQLFYDAENPLCAKNHVHTYPFTTIFYELDLGILALRVICHESADNTYPVRSKNAALRCCNQHAHPILITLRWKRPNGSDAGHLLIGTLEGGKCLMYDPNGASVKYQTKNGPCPVDSMVSRVLQCKACNQTWQFARYGKNTYKAGLQRRITESARHDGIGAEGLCAIVCILILVIRMVSGESEYESESVSKISDHIFDYWGEGGGSHGLYAWIARLAKLYQLSTEENVSQQNIITCLFQKPPCILWCVRCLRLISCVDLVFCHFCCAKLFRNGGCISRFRTEKTMRQSKRSHAEANKIGEKEMDELLAREVRAKAEKAAE